MLEQLGRVLKRGVRSGSAGPLAIGAAVALGLHAGGKAMSNPDSPNSPGLFSTIKEGLLDFAMGDPYADIDMMGFPITPSDVFPILKPPLPAPLGDFDRGIKATKWAYDNPEYGGLTNIIKGSQDLDRLHNWYMNQASADVKRGYTTSDYGDNSIFPYAPLTRRSGSYASSSSTGVQADGSMVFGMYNLRQG